MSKLYCSCQNYSGYLFVSSSDLYFSSSLFRLDLPYSNVKKITIDTKQVRGTPSSVLVIHLQKHQTVSIVGSDGTTEKRKRSSKQYFFYGFHDLLGAEELIKGNWESAKKSVATSRDVGSKSSNDAKADTMVDLPFERASTQNSTSRPPPPGSAPPALARADVDSRFSRRRPPSVPSQRGGPTLRRSRKNVTDAIGSAVLTALKGTTSVLLSGGPLALLFVFLVFVLVLFTGYHVRSFAARHRSPMRAAAELSSKLSLAREHARNVDASVSEGSYQEAQAEWNRLFERGDEWIKDLEKAASELTRQYVYAQVEMAALRQRRLERVGIEGYFSANEGLTGQKGRNTFPEFQPQDATRISRPHGGTGSAASTASSAQPQRRPSHATAARSRSFSVRRAKDDVTRWLSWVGRAQRIVTSAFWSHSFSLLPGTGRRTSRHRRAPIGTPNTRYAESFVPGLDIAQWVSNDEAEERQTCIALNERLFELACNIEHLLFTFFNVLVTNSAEEFATGVAKPHHFSRVPAAAALGNNKKRDLSYHPSFSGDQILKLAFIRRYTETMLFLDPIEGNENRRRMQSRAASQSFHNNLGLYAFSVPSAPAAPSSYNSTSAGSRLTEYITKRSAMSDTDPLLADTTRNILEEVVLWSRYPEELTAHRLRTLSPGAQRQVLLLLYKRLAKTGAPHIAQVTNITEAADAYLEQMRRVRPYQLNNVPVFRGMMCFSKQPVVERSTDHSEGGSGAGGKADGDSDDGNGFQATGQQRARSRVTKDADAQETEVRSYLQSAKGRWMKELDIYDIAIGDAPTTRVGKSRSVLFDSDLRATNPGLSDTRTRLFGILERFNRNYVPSHGGIFAPGGRLRRAARWLWPPSYFPTRKQTVGDTDILRRMGTLDPVAQMVSAQMVNVPWGNEQDAPLQLLETAFIQPPQLLQLRRDFKKRIIQAWLLFCVFLVVLAVLHFFT